MWLVSCTPTLDGSTEPVYGLQFYPQDIVREQGIVDALLPVKERMPHPRGPLRLRASIRFQTAGSPADSG